ncbi:hypothetical protein BDY21DRAFT_376670 [Lineolata rhizophorae]|uniref:Uncharacterized protein n=1 Tax=Lineolata rhizophorae TaxID=578093 RepID=A0A6A6PA03_9PEZI|nr:hypothetical protein BDY21DRAFT_376670 [Lineolata rhizophorae]
MSSSGHRASLLPQWCGLCGSIAHDGQNCPRLAVGGAETRRSPLAGNINPSSALFDDSRQPAVEVWASPSVSSAASGREAFGPGESAAACLEGSRALFDNLMGTVARLEARVERLEERLEALERGQVQSLRPVHLEHHIARVEEMFRNLAGRLERLESRAESPTPTAATPRASSFNPEAPSFAPRPSSSPLPAKPTLKPALYKGPAGSAAKKDKKKVRFEGHDTKHNSGVVLSSAEHRVGPGKRSRFADFFAQRQAEASSTALVPSSHRTFKIPIPEEDDVFRNNSVSSPSPVLAGDETFDNSTPERKFSGRFI